MPRKPVKWGIKAFSLNESETGYTYSWMLYTGAASKETKTSRRLHVHVDTDSSPSKYHPSDLTIPGEVVVELLNGLEHKGHVIYCDNYFNRPALVSKLSQLGFGCCGPVRYTAQGIPNAAHPKTNRMKKGDNPTLYEKAGQLCIVWHDNKNVVLLTNVGDCRVITKQIRCKKSESGLREIAKPKSIDNYNKFMGGTDLANQIFQYYTHTHRSLKWWKRVFFSMLNISMLNATVIYNSIPTNKHVSNLDFRLQVIDGLLTGWERNTMLRFTRSNANNLPVRLMEKMHYPGKNPSGRKRDCIVCSNRRLHNRKQTRMICKQCTYPMCVDPCFEKYHTLHKLQTTYFEITDLPTTNYCCGKQTP